MSQTLTKIVIEHTDITGLSIHDDGCLGCQKHNKDILLCIHTENIFYDMFLTKEQAIDLANDLNKKIVKYTKTKRELALVWWRELPTITKENYILHWQKNSVTSPISKNYSFLMIDNSSSNIEKIYDFING